MNVIHAVCLSHAKRFSLAIVLASPAILTISVTCPTAAFAGNITYIIEPVSLSGFYTVTGGFITTNGTLGPLSPTDILDYEFQVSGLVGYVFNPGNPASAINIQGTVTATPSQIELPIDSDPDVTGNGMFITAFDNTPSVCIDCAQRLTYSNNLAVFQLEASRVVYEVFTEPDVPEPEFLAFTTTSPQIVQTIATVPEPSSIMLSLRVCVW